VPEPTAATWERPEQRDRRADAEAFRTSHPELVVADPVWQPHGNGGTWTWTVSLAGGPTFASRVDLDVAGPPLVGAPALEVGRALAVVDSLSYWKAAASPRLRFAFVLPGTLAWWERFAEAGMAEFLWTNGLDPDWLPAMDAEGTTPMPPATGGDRGAALLLHSGGKDSIVSGLLLAAAGRAVRTVTYQDNAESRAVVAASAPPAGWTGPPATIGRVLDSQLLDLNAGGYLNGHTPYSAWIAVAATAVAELVGAGRVAAGNSASDDEDNIIGSWRDAAWPVNHQWSKSAGFETAWADLTGPDRRYASPLRPLHELAVVAGIVATDPPGTRQALSCNRSAKAGRPGRWCGRCPKCMWMALAVGALAGRDAAVARLGVDPLADPTNAPLVAAMCGRRGPIPFECAGLPSEVRACVRSVRSAGEAPALVELTAADLDDGPSPPTVGELVRHTGPAPLLDDDEHAAVAAWIATAT
jgi:UDP-N-acetyl-alpha-D-muramoyl-L-alanyl-L-glutamate epimerase